MPRSAKVSAVGDTTLSWRSSRTWSGVSSGFGNICRKKDLNSARLNGSGTNSAAAAGFLQHDLHQLLEAVGHRPAQLIGLATGRFAGQRGGDGGGDIAHEDRLEAGLAAADQGQGGQKRASPAKRLKKLSSGPKTMEGRRMVAAGKAARSRVSPSALLWA